MPEFTSGVKSYIRATATVSVTFPVDFKDRAEITCYQCRFFRRNYRSCGLNGEICEFPDTHIGSRCPLTFCSREEENDKEDKKDEKD